MPVITKQTPTNVYKYNAVQLNGTDQKVYTLGTLGMAEVTYFVAATSSVVFVVEGTLEDSPASTKWAPIPTTTINSSGKTDNLPAASLTPAASDVLVVPVGAYQFVRLRQVSGAGTILVGASPLGSASVAGVQTARSLPSIREVTITFSLDTSAYAAGDLLADTQVLTGAMAKADANGYLVGFQLLDKDDQAAADMDVYMASASTSFGSENSAPNISDANAVNIIGCIPVLSTKWKDIGGAKLATMGGGDAPLPMAMTPASGTADVYVALVTQGTPTQTAAGITGRFWFHDGI